jgi:hypothetical protein
MTILYGYLIVGVYVLLLWWFFEVRHVRLRDKWLLWVLSVPVALILWPFMVMAGIREWGSRGPH